MLVIGTEVELFRIGSNARARAEAYSLRCKEYNAICATTRAQGLSAQIIAPTAHVYPTSSRSRLLWGFDAMKIARTLPKPDVVTVQDPFETGLIGWIIARWHGAAFHVQVHTDLCAPAFRKLTLLNRVRVLIAGFVVRRADRIRVVSSRIKEDIETVYAPRAPITVLPIYVDLARFKNARADGAGRFSKFKTKFLVVSRLEKEKNVMLAIESFAQAPQDACLIILDGGREKNKLQARAAKLGIAGRVFFEGRQDPAAFYALADLVLVPSHFEGYGLVIIEALAAGTPVLATDVGVAREAGAIITSPENFADALSAWIENGERIGRLAEYPYTSFDAYADAYVADIGGKNVT